MKDKDVIIERILKWAMFALFFYITRGAFFIFYCCWHLMKGRDELNEARDNRPLTEDELIEINKPDNLTDEDKIFFYEHPEYYKDKHGEYKEKIYYNCSHYAFPQNPTEIKLDKRYWKIGVYPNYQNPRFKNNDSCKFWWNKSYWDMYEEDFIGYLVKKKKYLETSILVEILGTPHPAIYRPEPYEFDYKENVAKRLKQSWTQHTLDKLGKAYAFLKEEISEYDKESAERQTLYPKDAEQQYLECKKRVEEKNKINNDQKQQDI